MFCLSSAVCYKIPQSGNNCKGLSTRVQIQTFWNRSQSNITINLSSCTPNPHDNVSKQTIVTAELIICKGLKIINCNLREFVQVRALPAVGRCPVSDVSPLCQLCSSSHRRDSAGIQQDPSPPTPAKLLIHTHHPCSTTQALVEINRNVFLAPHKPAPCYRDFRG